MENDISGNVRCLNPDDSSNIFQDDKAVRDVFPEESSIMIQLDQDISRLSVFQVLSWDRYHRKGNSRIAFISIENPFQRRSITDLPMIHNLNSLFNWNYLLQIQIWTFLYQSFFDQLDFVIQRLDFICTNLIQAFIKQWHIFQRKYLVTLFWELAEESSDSTGMNNLIWWTKCEIHEWRNWNTGQIETLR